MVEHAGARSNLDGVPQAHTAGTGGRRPFRRGNSPFARQLRAKTRPREIIADIWLWASTTFCAKRKPHELGPKTYSGVMVGLQCPECSHRQTHALTSHSPADLNEMIECANGRIDRWLLDGKLQHIDEIKAATFQSNGIITLARELSQHRLRLRQALDP